MNVAALKVIATIIVKVLFVIVCSELVGRWAIGYFNCEEKYNDVMKTWVVSVRAELRLAALQNGIHPPIPTPVPLLSPRTITTASTSCLNPGR